MSTRQTDILIVGAGPIGLELAWALKQHRLDCIQVDAGAIGNTLSWWSPGTKFFSSPERISIAGVPLLTPDQDKATREQYLAYLRQVAGTHNLRIETFTRVDDIDRAGDDFAVRTTRVLAGEQSTIRAQRIVLAIGNMHEPNQIGVPGEDDAPRVSHYLGEVHDYYQKKVLIVGGKNSAVEAAIRLYRVGAQVTISYRRDTFDEKRVKYWLRPELEWLISKGRIAFLPETSPVRFDDGRAVVACNNTGKESSLDVDFVLLLTGYQQNPALFENTGVSLTGDDRAPRLCRRTMESSVPGVFVAGTAAAGSERTGVKTFIETAHVHVDRIANALTGQTATSQDEDYSALEEA